MACLARLPVPLQLGFALFQGVGAAHHVLVTDAILQGTQQIAMETGLEPASGHRVVIQVEAGFDAAINQSHLDANPVASAAFLVSQLQVINAGTEDFAVDHPSAAGAARSMAGRPVGRPKGFQGINQGLDVGRDGECVFAAGGHRSQVVGGACVPFALASSLRRGVRKERLSLCLSEAQVVSGLLVLAPPVGLVLHSLKSIQDTFAERYNQWPASSGAH